MSTKTSRYYRDTKKNQDEIIKKQIQRIQINLRKAVFLSILLHFMKKRPHYAREIFDKITLYTKNLEDYSEDKKLMNRLMKTSRNMQPKLIYDNLKKFEKMGLLGSYKEKSNIGPERKYYYITKFGQRYFDEVIKEALFIRIFYLYNFIEAGIEKKNSKPSLTKKNLNLLKKIFDQLTG